MTADWELLFDEEVVAALELLEVDGAGGAGGIESFSINWVFSFEVLLLVAAVVFAPLLDALLSSFVDCYE